MGENETVCMPNFVFSPKFMMPKYSGSAYMDESCFVDNNEYFNLKWIFEKWENGHIFENKPKIKK